ncbi:MAG: HD domain-containing protein [Thiohalocapsa sp.]|uniref:HD domain-containing protein n=1 Tax=Thiohalocapsa sp. TaxID=2497641 RepID=UPI0025D625EE|nr:HD domain-containing protein [Thiohalocapsa sp.]MCG6940292.1 HD domain-containing protein [Thiohalocapsa sp.]
MPNRLTPRFEDALLYANRLHATQTRKGSGVPYVSHLLAVASLVLEAGGDEDTAVAALLHDAVEDQGGLPILAEIRARFGDTVADIVAACSDSFTSPKPPWHERKRAYIAHLRDAPPEVLLVSCADKLHNARAIATDHRRLGDNLWERFHAGRDDILWYYRELSAIFSEQGPEPLATELALVVERLHRDTT